MSNTALLKTTAKPRLSVKVQTLATIAAIIGAVVVPQIFHTLGAVSGLGTALGETFLPMHLPIILVGLLAGPYAELLRDCSVRLPVLHFPECPELQCCLL